MAASTSNGDVLQALKPLVGEWKLVATFKDMPPADAGAHVTFEWYSLFSLRAVFPRGKTARNMIVKHHAAAGEKPGFEKPNSPTT